MFVVGLCSVNPLLFLGALVLGFAGLGFMVVATFTPREGAVFRERFIVGGGLLGTAVVLYLMSPECHDLLNDSASSVSNAPG